ncbi:hypothetical protein K1T71_007606 [Dendrolimus kikuchii]|uniref:Uncharacterized protein n=1 Tax=Dendrolimus kikuchii TaxID=765133 RepID=A0ACC1CYR9_9NEOP|nr:hypothetical protein K1T71_007606 [Dendrolimus kikuchii]
MHISGDNGSYYEDATVPAVQNFAKKPFVTLSKNCIWGSKKPFDEKRFEPVPLKVPFSAPRNKLVIKYYLTLHLTDFY